MMLYGAMKNMGVYFTSRPIHLRKSFSEKLKMEKQFYGEPFAGRTQGGKGDLIWQLSCIYETITTKIKKKI